MNEQCGVNVSADFTLRKYEGEGPDKVLVEVVQGGDYKPSVVTRYDRSGHVVGQVVFNPLVQGEK